MSINISPIAFYSFLTIASAFIAGLVLLLFCLRKPYNQTVKFFFKHYIIGFFILGFTSITSFLVNLGINLSYNLYISVFLWAFFATAFAYLIFFRGTVLLLTKNKFLTTGFPIIFLLYLSFIVLTALFITKAEVFTTVTIIFFGFLFPIKLFLVSIYFYFFIKGIPSDTMKGEFHTLLLSFAWFVALILDVYLWLSLANSAQEFWILKLASLHVWYIAKILTYLLILAALLLYSRHLHRLSVSKES